MRTIAHAIILMAIIMISLVCTGGVVEALTNENVQTGLKLLEQPDPNNIARAISIFQSALSANPNQKEAHMGIVYARILEYIILPEKDQEGLQDGLKHVDSVLKSNPKHEDAYYKKSQILFFLGKYEEGIQNLKSALKHLPESEILHEAMLVYLINTGRIEEAIQFSRLSDSEVKDIAGLHIRLGNAWLLAGLPQQARGNFLRSNAILESPQAWEGITRSFIAEGNFAGAIEWLVPYTEAFPEDLNALENLAIMYEKTGENIKARLTWMKLRAKSDNQEKKRLAAEHIESLSQKKGQ